MSIDVFKCSCWIANNELQANANTKRPNSIKSSCLNKKKRKI